MKSPETRLSLIFRLQTHGDDDAWQQFSEIYRPIILRMAMAKGLQRADADDLAQRVLLSVAGAIERWKPSGQAKFRTWLKRVTDNAILNAISRTKPDQAIGNDEFHQILNQQPERNGTDSQLLRDEFRSEIMHWAARRIRNEFSDVTWSAFWLTAVEGQPAAQVGEQLGRSRGSIYTARSRVMQRLVQKVNEFDNLEESE